MKNFLEKHVKQYDIGIAVVMLLTFLCCMFQPMYAADRALTDQMWQQPEGTNAKIKIIKIDEKTLSELGQYNTWTREIPARLVEILSQDPENAPAVISFDILYINEMDKEGDERFAEACRQAGNVITATNLVYQATTKQDANGDYYVDPLHITMMEESYPALREVTGDAFANTVQDEDGYIRQAIAWANVGSEKIYSLAYATYAAYMEKMGEDCYQPKVYDNHQFEFDYSGRSGEYENVSLCDVLNGTIDPRVFKDCIVFVGAYAPGMQDSFHVAVQRKTQMYGVEIHANIVDALLKEKTAVPVNKWLLAVLMALVAGLCSRFIWKSKIWAAGILTAVITVAEFAVGMLLYRNGYVMPLIYLPLILSVVYVVYVVSGYLVGEKKRWEIMRAFKKYVAPQIVDEVSKGGEFQISLGGERREIAAMFVDIRGFTSLSENLEPEEVVEILNEYLNLTTHAIFKNGGTLDKFIGDATMAVFNAPFDLDDYIYRAVCTARDIVAGAQDLEDRMEKRFHKKVNFGIGISCGPAVVGNVGCDFRMDYTAIGDTVNTASRLEGKAMAREILISEQVYEALKDRIRVTEKGMIPLKGKAKEICVYSVEEVL